MHDDHDVFVQGIHDKKRIKLTFFGGEDGGKQVRSCAPVDFGPSSQREMRVKKYHLWDYESDSGPGSLSLLPNQIKQIEATEEDFKPADFVIWKTSWFIERDWGVYG